MAYDKLHHMLAASRTSPASTPTALSMLIASGLLLAVLMLPDRSDHRQAGAAELAPISITPATAGRAVSFRDRLVAGLRARLKSEVAFVDEVVDLVEKGKISERMVNETFFWSRMKADPQLHRGRSIRPIRYFQPAMIVRLKAIGIVL